jgi:hypothetical protein
MIYCHASQFCLYFMMHITLLNHCDTVNDTVAIRHGSEVVAILCVSKLSPLPNGTQFH